MRYKLTCYFTDNEELSMELEEYEFNSVQNIHSDTMLNVDNNKLNINMRNVKYFKIKEIK